MNSVRRFILYFCLTFITIQITQATSVWQRLANALSAPFRLGPSITTAALPIGKTSTPYSTSLAASGGKQPYSWSASGLPAGFMLTGPVLSGSTAVITNASVAVTVRDRNGRSASKTFPLAICAPIQILAQTLPAATVGVPYSAQLQAQGGVGPGGTCLP